MSNLGQVKGISESLPGPSSSGEVSIYPKVAVKAVSSVYLSI